MSRRYRGRGVQRKSKALGNGPATNLSERVVRALRARGRPGHADTLTAFLDIAELEVLETGVFAPYEDEQYKMVESVALEHLGFLKAKGALSSAIASLEERADRDAIEVAQNAYQALSDDAYYYFGLAVGLTTASLNDR